MNLNQVPLGDRAPDLVNAIVEIPRGSNMKYEYDESVGLIRLGRVLYSPSFYPVDYGFIPQTIAPNGDHLDVLIVVNEAAVPGSIQYVRPLGVLHMCDEGGPDDKILAVTAVDPRFDEVTDLETLSPHVRSEISHFFEVYKALEAKEVEVQGWSGRETAHATIRAAHAAWLAAQPPGATSAGG